MAGIVDLHGRAVSDLQVKGSSMVKGRQWVEYLDAHAQTISESEPWVRLLLNAVMSFHQGFIIMSRRLRKNRAWAGSGTMAEDTIGLVDDAAMRLAWFEKNSEQVDQRGLPEWARFMFVSIEGGLRMQLRLAGETEQVLRKGHLLLAVDRQGELVETKNEDNPDHTGGERE